MSVEAFTHQLYEPLVIPDELETSLRRILIKELHLTGEDVEHALHNPWDMCGRLTALLVERYEQTDSQGALHVYEHAYDSVKDMNVTIGTGMSDAMQVGLTKKLMPNGTSYPLSSYISLDMEHIDPMRQGGVLAIIEISDDIARIQTIGNDYRRGQNKYTKKSILPNDPAINKIYLEVYERLVAAIDNPNNQLDVSDFVKSELGKVSLFKHSAA